MLDVAAGQRDAAIVCPVVMVMVMVIFLGPSPVPPIYLAGSFGLVRPAWIRYTRSAVPQNAWRGSPRCIAVVSLETASPLPVGGLHCWVAPPEGKASETTDESALEALEKTAGATSGQLEYHTSTARPYSILTIMSWMPSPVEVRAPP